MARLAQDDQGSTQLELAGSILTRPTRPTRVAHGECVGVRISG
jgi:hypothetical protein